MTNARDLMNDLQEMRELLLKLWQEAIEAEDKRVNGIFTLYEEVVKSN